MTRDDIIRMAREVWGDDSGKPWHVSAVTHLEAFAKLVAEYEREACANLVEQAGVDGYGTLVAALLIRERGAP